MLHRISVPTCLAGSTVFGVAVAFLAVPVLTFPLGVALAWVLAVALFLVLTVRAIGSASPDQVRRHARQEDPYRWVLFAILVVAPCLSLFAVALLLRPGGSGGVAGTSLRITLAGLAVMASWTMTHTSFGLRYAHLYYGDIGKPGEDRRGLDFPGTKEPDYWDFWYYSFVVGMTCQVSDVQISSRPLRRLTLLHGILSFFFNTVILALAISFTAGAL